MTIIKVFTQDYHNYNIVIGEDLDRTEINKFIKDNINLGNVIYTQISHNGKLFYKQGEKRNGKLYLETCFKRQRL